MLFPIKYFVFHVNITVVLLETQLMISLEEKVQNDSSVFLEVYWFAKADL